MLCFIIKTDERMSLYNTKAFQLKRMKETMFFSQKNQKRKNKMVKEKVLKLANIIRSGIEQMDEPFSS